MLLVAAAASIAVVHAARHEIAEWLIGRTLGDAVADFEVAAVTWRTVTMTNVVLSQRATLEGAQIHWSMGGLISGHLDRLTLAGWKADRFTLPEMAVDMTGLATEVVVREAEVDLSGPWGTIVLTFDSRMSGEQAPWIGRGAWQAVALGLEGAGDLAFSWNSIEDRAVIDIGPAQESTARGAGPEAGRIVVRGVTSGQPEIAFHLTWPRLEAGRFDIDGTLDANRLQATASLVGDGTPLVGDISVAGRDGTWQVDATAISGTFLHVSMALDARIADMSEPTSWVVTGDGVVQTAGLSFRPWLAMEEANAAVALSLADGRLRASLAAPLPVMLTLGSGLRLDLSLGMASLEVWRQGADLGMALETSGEVAGQGSVRARVAGDVALDGAGRVAALGISEADIVMEGAVSGRINGSAEISGGPDTWRGGIGVRGLFDEVVISDTTLRDVSIDLPLTLAGASGDYLLRSNSSGLLQAGEVRSPALHVSGVDFELPFGINVMERGIVVRQTDTGWIDLQSLTHGPVRLMRPVSIKLAREPLPFFVLERLGKDLSWGLRLQLDDTPLHAVVFDDTPRAATIEGVLPDLALRLERLGGHYLQATMEAMGGELVVAGPDIRIREVRALLNYNSGLSPWPQFSADVKEIDDMRTPGRFAPVSVDVVVTPVWPAGDDARLSMTLHTDRARFLGAVDARYMTQRKRLEASVRAAVAFSEQAGLQPRDISPLYGRFFSDVRGGVNVAGTAWFEGDGSGADLSLDVHDVSARIAGVTVRHASGTTTFTDLLPLKTPPGQTFSAVGVDAPVPLRDVDVMVSWPGDGTVMVEGASARLPEGQPFSIEPAGHDGHTMTLRLSGLDAATLLDHAGVSEFALDGHLDGEVAVLPDWTGLVIDHLELRTSSPGVVSLAGNEARTYDTLMLRYDRRHGTIGSMRVTMTQGRCRMHRELLPDRGIDELAGSIAAWMDKARCDST